MIMRRTALASVLLAGTLMATVSCGSESVTPQAAPSTHTVTVTVTASPSPSPTATVPPASAAPPASPAPPAATVPALTNAAAVVSQYYQDLIDQNYAAAWALGGSNIAGETYDQYVAGFATTATIDLGTVSQFGSSKVQANFEATQTDGTVKNYQGTYTVANGVLVQADIRQTS